MAFIGGASSFQLPAASFGSGAERRRLLKACDAPFPACTGNCIQSWKLEAGSRKPYSHFLRKRVPQPVEHEVAEQEPQDRDRPEEQQGRQVAYRALEEQDLLVGNRQMRERVQLQKRGLPDVMDRVRGILEQEPRIDDRGG